MVKLKNKLVVGNRSLQEQLVIDLLRFHFKKLKILPNDKTAIGKEIDILLADYKIGIEIDGPTHTYPIYGEETLNKIQIRDMKKTKLCEEAGITLIRIKLPKDSRTYYSYIKKEIEEIIVPVISKIIENN